MSRLEDIRSWRGFLSPNFRRTLGYLKPERPRIAVYVLLSLLNLPLSLVEPYILMYLVDRILLAGRPDLLLPFGVRIIPYFLLASCVQFLLTYTLLKMARELHYGIKSIQLDNLMRKSLGFFQNNATGQVLFAFFNDSNSIGGLLTVGLLNTAMSVLYVLVRLCVLGWIDPVLMVAYLAVLPFQLLLMWRMMKVVMRLEIDLKKRDEDLTARIESLLQGAIVIKSFGFAGSMSQIWKDLFGVRLDVDLRNMIWKQLGGLGVANIQAVGVFFVLFLGVHKVAAGELSLGSVLAFMSISAGVTPALHGLVGFLVGAQEAFVNIERYYRIYDVPDEARQFSDARVVNGPIPSAELEPDELREVTLRDVVVQHGDGTTVQVPCEVAMQRGENILWYGRNGAGKTSLALALAGLVPHAPGTIRGATRPLSDFTPRSIHRHVLYVGAEPFWPEQTLAENFANGQGGAPDPERLAWALDCADAERVLDALPAGMETVLSHDGHVLSRGENQRLFLAMALYRQPAVLILDEALSHVASASVRRIFGRLADAPPASLIVHVSQRPSDEERWDQRVEIGDAA